ncbi:hypothetical protein BH20ACI2_BH20ACI2_10920 [soil metagenome]
MLSISKESLAPRIYEGLREFHRYNSQGAFLNWFFAYFCVRVLENQNESKKLQGKRLQRTPTISILGCMMIMSPIWRS